MKCPAQGRDRMNVSIPIQAGTAFEEVSWKA